MMKYLLYCVPGAILQDLPCNAGIESALAQIEELRRQGTPVEFVDSNRLAPDELQSRYIAAILPSVLKKYRVRQVFGSRRRAGWLFGRGVPALVVLGPSGVAEDIYPHESGGRFLTILDFCKSLGERANHEGSRSPARRKRR
jgi:hypothetical protein